MAGFRIGRGRDNRNAQQQRQYPPPPQQAPGTPRGQQPGRPPQAPPPPQSAPRAQWPQAGGAGGARHGEPEYLGDPRGHGAPQGGSHNTYAANTPGHTQAFSVPDPYGPTQGQGQGYPDDGYGQGSTYGPGGPGNPPPPSGPRLHWKQLLSGIVLRPHATFWQMRDYPVWGPALIVTFVYGLLAVFGLAEARQEVFNATLSSAIPYVLTTGIAVVVAGLIMGAVTHTLARQFGGDGAWQPTVGLSMLIMSMTDAPRLVFAWFLGGTAPLVQVLGWVTWVFAGFLFTSMVSRSHDLPWPKALGASAVQLAALLALIKLGTL
ncbi:Yip1 family protein [Streptomyces sp. ODS28]|uniref:Yip1 family protein n=1 Tax=Streptomyces sp. ODS28 TaxID=3136688 RepID=UPI0031EFBD5A